jgi:hypothetical protein
MKPVYSQLGNDPKQARERAMSSLEGRHADRAKPLIWVVFALFLMLSVGGIASLMGWWSSDTLEPLPEPPREIAGYPAISLVALLNRSRLDQLTLASEFHILRQAPIFQRLPDTEVPNPPGGMELRLDWSEARVYAEPSEAGGYRLVVFCMPQRKCYSTIRTGAPPEFWPVAFLQFGAKDAAEAQLQLEALRRLILLEGGVEHEQPDMSLKQRLKDVARMRSS